MKKLAVPKAATGDTRQAAVAIGFVAGMLSGLAARAIDTAPLLAAAGLDPAVLGDPRARVPLTAYAALYNRVVTTLDDEGFGLFAVKLKPGMFEFLGRAVIGSRDLGEALDRAARFLRLVLPDLVLQVGDDGRIEISETIAVGTSRDDPRRVFAFEWLLRLIHGVACWLAGRALPLDSVAFPYARPAQADDYALIYTEHPTFGAARLTARFHKDLLRLPVIRDQDAMADFLDGAPGKIAVLYRRDHEMARQVREILAAAPEAPDLAAVTGRLHLSSRTVQRRLKQEGASFRSVKAALRRNAAIALVKDGLPISEIALKLGYAEPSAFFRAFVKWTGESPTSYRKKLRPAA